MQIADQTGNTIVLPGPARRIVSLVPSQTELLYDLGLEQEVVGITRFCIYPDHWYRNKTRVGGTKDFDTDRIRALKPDLILANKEENTQKGIQELMKEFPVWVSDISHLDDALNMIASTGTLTGKDERAMSIIQEIRHGFDALAGDPQLEALRGKRAVYYIWKKPWMVAGSDTFICDMMKRCGFIPFPVPPRYPELDPALLASSDIDYVLLSSEPYPFGEKERVLIENLLPDSRIRLVDGTFFSWYGSRLKNAPSYFNSVFR